MIGIYINPFWAGILLTIIAEVIIVMVIAFIDMRNADYEEEENKDDKSS